MATTTPLTVIKKAISLGFSRKNFQNTDLLAEACFYLENLAESGKTPSISIEGEISKSYRDYNLYAYDAQTSFEYEESGSSIDEIPDTITRYRADINTGNVFKIVA